MKLLIATYNFPPESYGGSEVYVESLTKTLLRAGHQVTIVCATPQAPPAGRAFSLRAAPYDGLDVWRLAVDDSQFTPAERETTRSERLRDFWKQWLAEHRPDVVSMQGHNLAASDSIIDAAHDLNIPLLYTLHSAAVLCPKGNYNTWRGEVCDGATRLLKCTRCIVASKRGSAAGVAAAFAAPVLSRFPLQNRWPRSLGLPAMLRARFASHARNVDILRHWHAFSDWTRAALVTNGVEDSRITLLRYPGPDAACVPHTPRKNVLRIAFFGRFHPAKGLPVLLDAMRRIPDARLHLDIFGAPQLDFEAAVAARLQADMARDPRIAWHGRIEHSAQPAALASIDVVVVPSTEVETGPLTVLEAFAAGVPVIGADVSGINERVTEGRNGWLFPIADSSALAACLARLAHDPSLVDAARDFPPLDSMQTHAARMMDMFESLANNVN